MKLQYKIAGIVASLIAVVIGSGYGYQVHQVNSAKTICDAGSANLTKWQQDKNASTEGLIQAIADAEKCSKALNSIPFKNSEVSERISKVDEAVSRMRSAVPLMAMAEGLQNVFQPKTQNQPEVKPSPVQFEDLPLCEQLDGIAKSGKSVSDFIVNSGRFSDFDAAIKTSCNWHTSQSDRAYTVLNPPVQTTVVQSSQSATDSFCDISETCHPHHGQWLANENAKAERRAEIDGTVRSVQESGVPAWTTDNITVQQARDINNGGTRLSNCNGIKEPGEISNPDC